MVEQRDHAAQIATGAIKELEPLYAALAEGDDLPGTAGAIAAALRDLRGVVRQADIARSMMPVPVAA